MARLNTQKSEMMEKVLANPACTWKKKTREIMNKYRITEEDLIGSKAETKYAIQVGAYIKFYGKMKQSYEDRSKLKFFLDNKVSWKPQEAAEYMTKLTRKQASIIFKARTRMIKVKGNYKNACTYMECRACKQAEETQTHVLNECTTLHPPRAPTLGNNVTKGNDIQRLCTDKNCQTAPMTGEQDRDCDIENSLNTANASRNDIDDNTRQDIDIPQADPNSKKKNSPHDIDPHSITNDKIFSEDSNNLRELSKLIEKTLSELMIDE